jgi:large subunit ribosomal protein L13
MPKKIITRAIVTLDAEGQSIGRVATKAATILIGKHKADYAPEQDMGDMVEIRNAAKVKITGKKLEQKAFYNYSGYPGGMKAVLLKTAMAKNPGHALEIAVSSMLPKNRLRKPRMNRLKVHND